MNRRIRGLTSIRKGLEKGDSPFLVDSNSIIASENVSGRASVEIYKASEKLSLQTRRGPNPEGFKFLQIRRGPNPEGSRFLQNRRGTNPEGSKFLQNRRGPIRRGRNFTNPVRSDFCQSGGVPILPIRRGPIFVNPEEYYFVKT